MNAALDPHHNYARGVSAAYGMQTDVHQDLFEVVRLGREAEYLNVLVSKKSFAKGSRICALPKEPLVAAQSSTTIRARIDEPAHLDLSNSDLLYIVHSCEPNVRFDVPSGTLKSWSVMAEQAIKPGDTLSMFYPSLEWSLSSFQCNCGSEACLSTVKGAEDISEAILQKYARSEHVQKLKAQQPPSPEAKRKV